ncbi:acyltransferase family protein [Promethearchaeum syntrophicum]|uniref:Acyltransferase family protein n=1 Tax=Promethearchaeum syntrophicum TaxID=2594042 RepID=A0A5B9D992_9ARCH|nr:acyltransferase family protein [Candidatus Prometheoarchaeum syntrophicum]QEE15176.1 Acyltransferase family protein [Candidatus Prometheoarchaeum syntrophicum]
MRIKTFDILRGISILFMLITHGLLYWLDPQDAYILIIYRFISNTFLVNGFIFVSGLGFGFSWNHQLEKGTSKKEIYRRSLIRTLIILILSLFYNIIAVFINDYGWNNLWYWYILQTIAFSRLLGLLLIKIPKRTRFLFLLFLILFTPLLLNGLLMTRDSNTAANIIYFILFNQINANSIMIFLPFFLIGTIFGQDIFEFSEDTINIKLKKWFILGFLMLLSGIIIGCLQYSDSELGTYYIQKLNRNPNWMVQELPLFLIRGSYVWCLYSIGWEIIILVFVFYIVENKRKKKVLEEKPHMLVLFGKYSLSIYLSHYLFFIIQLECSPVLIWFPIILLILTIWLVIYFLNRYENGTYSIEYLISFIVNQTKMK